MTVHTVNQIRTAFLEFFEKQNHTIVPSSSLVPHNDPTLMFTNAGMVPFKNLFTGKENRDYTRAASSQKCVRAGGKHNDLDNVGYTARHHTFFEMLGNFSFGDYFKEECITFAWDFLVKELSLPKDKLYITVYHTDDEAFDLWKKITSFSDDRILRIDTNDNFWAMGDTGPCGPCSEVFYDHGESIPGGLPGTPEQEGDRFVEIWNLVFMQYDKQASGEQAPLPKPSIDTGMGLERIAAVLQGVHDNYDIDLFRVLIEASQHLSGNDQHETSHRVIADHLRSSAFLIADGVMPSNEGRGYVLRRIMRRAMRHVHQLGSKEPLMYRLIPTLVEEMGAAYPELDRAKALITETLQIEEEKFNETLGRGLKLLEQETTSHKKGERFSGEVAFKLYDTYGFPLDLTRDILRGQEIDVDIETFDSCMEEQRQRARAAWSGSGEAEESAVWFTIQEAHGASEFVGYDATSAEGQVVAIVVDNQEVEQASTDEEVLVVLNQTPFYAESGGQIGDAGSFVAEGLSAEIYDTKKKANGLHVHKAKLSQGTLKVGDIVTATIDADRRTKIRSNHSATHILHGVLRDVLGEQAVQKGSLVASDRLRFDISYNQAITPEQLIEVEKRVNTIIRDNEPVDTNVMSPDDAIEAGAVALFGEKYGDEVRVVKMGESVELCGGTHVRRSGDIGYFKIIDESAIAAGIRRIEALTGEAALEYMANYERTLYDIAQLLKVSPDEVGARVQSLMDERKQLEKEISQLRKASVMGGGDAAQEEVNGIAFMAKTLADIPPKELRPIVEELKAKLGSGVVVVAASFEDKASLVIGVTDDLAGNIDAAVLVKEGAVALGGQGGGGRPTLAQAGGPDASKLQAAIDKVKSLL